MPGRAALVAPLRPLDPRRRVGRGRVEEVGDVRVGAEAAAAHADAVLVAEDRGDEPVVDPGDRERDDADLVDRRRRSAGPCE